MSAAIARARRALVAGGSGAVGGAVCRTLAARGVRVAFTYHRNRAAAEALAQAIDAVPIEVDLADAISVEAAVDRAVAALGGVDIYVHAAGLGYAVPAPTAPETIVPTMDCIDAAAWDRMLAVTARSAFLAVRRLAPHLAAGGGDVVLIGSVDAVKPSPVPPHFLAAKAALRGLTVALAKELGPRGVRVNLVAPGVLDGGMAHELPASIRRSYLQHSGMKRIGRLDEAAALVAFLALENTYLSGQTLALDGGL